MVFLPSKFDLINWDAIIQLLPSQRPSVCGWSADTNLATGLQPKLKDNEEVAAVKLSRQAIVSGVTTGNQTSKHLKGRLGPRVSNSFGSHTLGRLSVTVLARTLLAGCQ